GIAKQDGERQRDVWQVGNRVPRAQRHRHRRQRGTNLLLAFLSERNLLRLGEVSPSRQTDSKLFQFLETFTRALRLTIHDVGNTFANYLDLLPASEAVVALFFSLLCRFLSQSLPANHAMLTEVRAHYG